MLIDASQGLLIKGEPLLPLIMTPDFTFTLTGSQYFGNAKPTSDWDFIAQDSPALRDWLTSVGFTTMSSEKYECDGDDGPLTIAKYFQVKKKKSSGLGSGTAAIYQKQANGCTAQVQLSPNAARKIHVRNVIMRDATLLAGHGKLSREQRGRLWSALYDTLSLAL